MVVISKKILIFRTAQLSVMTTTIKYIQDLNSCEIELYCLTQKNFCDKLRSCYPTINYVMKRDGFFSYKEYLKNKKLRKTLESMYFDEIYLPSSTNNFSGFEDVKLIVHKIPHKKLFFINSNGYIYLDKVNFYKEFSYKLFGSKFLILCGGIKKVFILLILIICYMFVHIYFFIQNKYKGRLI